MYPSIFMDTYEPTPDPLLDQKTYSDTTHGLKGINAYVVLGVIQFLSKRKRRMIKNRINVFKMELLAALAGGGHFLSTKSRSISNLLEKP